MQRHMVPPAGCKEAAAKNVKSCTCAGKPPSRNVLQHFAGACRPSVVASQRQKGGGRSTSPFPCATNAPAHPLHSTRHHHVGRPVNRAHSSPSRSKGLWHFWRCPLARPSKLRLTVACPAPCCLSFRQGEGGARDSPAAWPSRRTRAAAAVGGVTVHGYAGERSTHHEQGAQTYVGCEHHAR